MINRALLTIMVIVAGCSSRTLEVVTTQPINVYKKPLWPNLGENVKVGELPQGVVVPVKDEVIQKDMAAYEIEYVDKNGVTVHGYVLHGDNGLDVREHKGAM